MKCQRNRRLTDAPPILRDDQWNRIRDSLPGRAGSVGVTAADNRRFVDAVIHRYPTGMPWRDLPAPKRFGEDRAIGRTEGGLSTKIHALVDALGLPLQIVPTGGQVHDLAGANARLAGMEAKALLADKAYDADKRVIELLEARGKSPESLTGRTLSPHHGGRRPIIRSRTSCVGPSSSLESQRATTRLPRTSWQHFTWWPRSVGSIDDRP